MLIIGNCTTVLQVQLNTGIPTDQKNEEHMSGSKIHYISKAYFEMCPLGKYIFQALSSVEISPVYHERRDVQRAAGNDFLKVDISLQMKGDAQGQFNQSCPTWIKTRDHV